jgi:hypothetical protein
VALDECLEEVHEARLRVLDPTPQTLLLLLGREIRREEEDRQVAVGVQRFGELAELLADLVEDAALLGDFEQRARIDPGDLFPSD